MENVGIIGAGITGLTTALALHKVGISCIVFERAKELNEIGAGVLLQPNALKVLDWLGIKTDVIKQGVELNRMEITNNQLKAFAKIKNEVIQDEFGNKTVAIHRGRLQKELVKAVRNFTDINLDKTYLNHSINSNSVKIQFADSNENVSFILGADGIHSAVRKKLFPESKLRSSHQICWRGISKINLPSHLQNFGHEAWGNKIRFGFSQVSENEVYWFAVANENHQEKKPKTDVKPFLIELFKEFHEIVPKIINNTGVNDIHEVIIHDLNRLDSWSSEKVCLLGDAAHATTPNMGQGACQGIEDAYYIAQILSKSIYNPNAAFLEFEQQRRKKVDFIVNNSWRFGQMSHSSFGQFVMKTIMRLTPESVLNSSMKKLYSI